MRGRRRRLQRNKMGDSLSEKDERRIFLWRESSRILLYVKKQFRCRGKERTFIWSERLSWNNYLLNKAANSWTDIASFSTAWIVLTIYPVEVEQETPIFTELVQHLFSGIVSSRMINGEFHDDLIQAFSVDELYRDGPYAGWDCGSVIEYDVVLANGDIVNAV